MKTGILFCFMISLFSFNCTQHESSSLEGVWKLTEWQQVSGDSLLWNFPGNGAGSEIKIWSGNNFLFVGRHELDALIMNNYGGGTYKLNGIRCEENLLYFRDTSLVGSTIRSIIEIKGDTLIQTWPADNNWKINKSEYLTQKFIRIRSEP